MKCEDAKDKIPRITDDPLEWLISESGADINREKAGGRTSGISSGRRRPSSRNGYSRSKTSRQKRMLLLK